MQALILSEAALEVLTFHSEGRYLSIAAAAQNRFLRTARKRGSLTASW